MSDITEDSVRSLSWREYFETFEFKLIYTTCWCYTAIQVVIQA